MDANHRYQDWAARAGFTNVALVSALLALSLLTSCGRGEDDAVAGDRATIAALKLQPLENCDAYKTFVTDSLVEQYRPRGWSTSRNSGGGVPEGGDVAMPAPASGGGASSSTSAPSHVTGTNNQETGVDEPDIVKTDAKGNFYIAHGNSLRIVAGHPPSALKELAAIDAGGAVYDLFLDEAKQRAVLFAAHYEQIVAGSPPVAADSIAMPGFYMRAQYVVSFVDVTNPAQPVLTARWTLDGYPLDSRRIDQRIHFVLSDPIELPAVLANDSAFWKLYSDYYNAPAEDAAKVIEQQIVDAIRTAVGAVKVEEMLPGVTIAKDGQTISGPILGCGDVSAPKVLTLPSLLTVASFDTDGANLSASAIMAYGATVYASPTNLYVTQYSGGWFSAEDHKPQTAIHQFGVSAAAPKYVATGLVDGWVLNSFALSEYNGDLRVATSSSTWSNGVSARTNDLFVLRENGSGELAVRGSVRNFGADESIFSARFLGTRGFVVTFRRIDPLFAFDLSNPDNPTLMGELTIPGFSTYMHPLGDKHLLTIGQDDTRGIQLQIFDVSDLANPKLAHKYSPTLPGDGYSYSEAQYDHHAFTYDETNKVLAIPLSYFNYNNNDYFSGIAAFNVDIAEGIGQIVRVDHAGLAKLSHCSGLPEGTTCDYWYSPNPRRSVIMTADNNVTLYSISDAGVKATGLAPPNDTLGSVVFPYEPMPIIIAPPVVIAQ